VNKEDYFLLTLYSQFTNKFDD